MKKLLILLGMISVTSFFVSCNEEEAAPTNLLSISADKTEYDEGIGTITLVITLDSPEDLSRNMNIEYAVSGSTNSGEDFKPLNGSAFFELGNESTEILLEIIDDDEKESDELFTISLSNRFLPEGVGLGDNTLTLTILDND